jgi:cytochrome c peroxidase
MSELLSRFIKLSTKSLTIILLTTISIAWADTKAQEDILRHQVLANGFRPAEQLYQNPHPGLAKVGKVIFESTGLSLNGNISCRTCHQDKFGSGDGIPNAAAILGAGVGPERLLSGAKLLPRNALPFWGRGAKGFNAFFWDGRVSQEDKKIISQFGSHPPSEDLMVVADHLPVVEIREMLDEDEFIEQNKLESVKNSQKIYKAIADSLRKKEPNASMEIASYFHKDVNELTYRDYAQSLASFIRTDFKIKETKLERFVFKKETLSNSELKGGLIFYGNGKCITCHSGPHFSDFKYHNVAFPQLGFGKNGFGVDYGRYNATFKTDDLYKFRTAPLFNVEKTAPYGHSGSAPDMRSAIYSHFDPLRLVDVRKMSSLKRNDLYKRMSFSKETAERVGYLTDEDVDNLVSFLRTLSF